jgi:hypothetical protein
MQWLEAGDEPNGVLERVGHGHGKPFEGLLRVVRQDNDVGDAVCVQDGIPQVLQPLVQQRRQNCEEQQAITLLQNNLFPHLYSSIDRTVGNNKQLHCCKIHRNLITYSLTRTAASTELKGTSKQLHCYKIHRNLITYSLTRTAASTELKGTNNYTVKKSIGI